MKMFAFLGVILSMVITSIMRGFVFQKLWLWFIVPLFGISPIGIAQSLGLMLIVGTVTSTNTNPENDKKTFTELMTRAAIKSVIGSAVYLIIGFIIKSFI